MTVATTFGIASVVAAVDRSIALSKLYEADSIRAWFSQNVDWEDKKRPLKSSIAAQELLDLPLALLLWGGISYIGGFGVYIGLIWFDNVPSLSLSAMDSRNVFICFMLSLLPLFVWSFWTTLKEGESRHTQPLIHKLRDNWRGMSLYFFVQYLMHGPSSLQPLIEQNNPQYTTSQTPIVVAPDTVPETITSNTSNATFGTSIPMGTMSAPSSTRYTIEQSDYIAALTSAAHSRRKAAEADVAVAALYEKLTVSTESRVKTELVIALKEAATEHQKCVDQDMLVINTYQTILVSQRGSSNV